MVTSQSAIPQTMIATLARAVLREDAGFHAYQVLEAGVRQAAIWGDSDERATDG